MERLYWLGFAFGAGALSRSFLHFFPSATHISAPYPINVTLSLFGSGVARRSLVLEGGRLGSPDGLRLEEAFSELGAEGPARLCGIELELTSPQRKLELQHSAFVFEFSVPPLGVRYRPLQLTESTPSSPLRALAVKDKFFETSILAVNGGEESRSLVFGAASVSISAGQVVEIALAPDFYQGCEPQACSWGDSRARSFELTWEGAQMGAALGCFVVYRDPESRRVVSILPLKAV